MTKTDTYRILRMCDDFYEQNNKLDKIAEQLEVQTRLQVGILKQLYLLCQIAATPSDQLKASYSNYSGEEMRAVRMEEHPMRMENKQ